MKKSVVGCVVVSAVLGLTGCTGEKRENSASPAATSDPSAWPENVKTEGDPQGQPTTQVTEPEPVTEPNTAETVAKPRETKTVEKPKQPADFGAGIKARIAATRGVTVKNVLPGEIAGPAVAIEVEYSNTGQKQVSLENSIVSVNYDGQEASAMTGSPAKTPPRELAPGQKATGVYVFGIPENKRKKVTIRVSYSPDAPQLVFNGPVG